jgi:acyl-CoA thioesterase-1
MTGRGVGAALGGGVAVLLARGLRVRLSVGPRRRYWTARRAQGGLEALTVVTLGDSLTQGIGSSRPSTSWLGRFVVELERTTGRPVRVDNRSVYGARVGDVITTQLPVPPGTGLTVLFIGSNDVGRLPPDQFRASMRVACAQLPAGSIVGDVPNFLWGPRVGPAAALSAVVREVVAEFPGLRLAAVQQQTAAARAHTDLAGDFFHPNDRGHRRIAAAFVAAARLDPAAAVSPGGVAGRPPTP